MTSALTPPPGGWPPGFPATGGEAEQTTWVLDTMIAAMPMLIAEAGAAGDDNELLHSLARRNLTHYPPELLAYLLAAALMRLDPARPA